MKKLTFLTFIVMGYSVLSCYGLQNKFDFTAKAGEIQDFYFLANRNETLLAINYYTPNSYAGKSEIIVVSNSDLTTKKV